MVKERSIILHPIWCALFPVLFLYVHNLEEITPGKLPMPLGIILAGVGICWLALARLLRSAERAALVVSVLLLFFFSYGHLYAWLTGSLSLIPGAYWWSSVYFLLWLILLAASLQLLLRAPTLLPSLTQGLNWGMGAIVILLALQIAGAEYSHWQQNRWREQVMRHDAIHWVKTDGQLPNIYYIILDSFGSERTLERVYHDDNRAFIHTLQRLGFYVAAESHANYCQTILSLASSLNFCTLDAVTRRLGANSQDRTLPVRMIQRSRVCALLRRNGYTIVDFPSGYAATKLESDLDITNNSLLSEFPLLLAQTTPLLLVSQLRDEHPFDLNATMRKRIIYTLNRLPETTALPGPCFVFAHIIAPHPPFVLDDQGRPLPPPPVEYRMGEPYVPDDMIHSEDFNRKYCDEVAYLSRRVPRVLAQIIATSRRPVVMILQADHGPGQSLTDCTTADLDVPERLGILNAIYLPGKHWQHLYPAITPVNIFPAVFATCFGMHVPHKPDDSYFSAYSRPYDFTRVTDLIRTNGN